LKALVTGGAGFLGKALVERLTREGYSASTLVRSGHEPFVDAAVTVHTGDLRDLAAVTRACEGVDVVFHAAAKAGGWGSAKDFEDSNVVGTDNVISACRACGVAALIFTSSPSVVHAPRDIIGENESLPYASHYLADYPRTKAEAERRVRAANRAGLRTVSLRPHFIWGPGDRHLLPRLVSRSLAGRLRRIGQNDPLTDTVYIDNCVDAHLQAAQVLVERPLPQDVYFISDNDPIGLWTMANQFLAAAGAPPVTRHVSVSTATFAATVIEGWYHLFSLKQEPPITRFAVSEMTHVQWFDISAAKRDFGYIPKVSIPEGLERLRRSLQT
jgi:2-alkyl-3-oxoalkanoate reductase